MRVLFENNFQSLFSMNNFVERFISELEMIKPSTKQQQAVGDLAP
jgi:hypothetical protein